MAKTMQMTPAGPAFKFIGRDSLRGLVSFIAGKQARIDALAGEMGAEIKSAADKKNLHKGAFALARRLDKMDDRKREEFLAHFDYYREQLKFDERAAKAREAADKIEAEADEGDEKKKPRPSRMKELVAAEKKAVDDHTKHKAGMPSPEAVQSAADRAEARSGAAAH